MFKYYLEIVKPGIVLGNIVLIIGGFLIASRTIFNLFLFFYTILGTSLVISSACVFNNLIDADIDQKMYRTKNRILSKNMINPIFVVIFGSILGFLGIFILGTLVNYLSMFLSIFGFFVYVILYTLVYKRKSIYSTFIGSFSGSIPSVIGYTAVTNMIDVCSILLFIIFIFWQMSHFYSISVFRFNDYKNAGIPVFPVIKGIILTKNHIFCYIFCFIIFSSLLTFFGYVSYFFFVVSSIINFYWLFLSFCDIQKIDNSKSSGQLFYFSIFVVCFFNFLILIDNIFLKINSSTNILQALVFQLFY